MPYKDKEQQKTASKEWAKANRKKRNATAKTWREANPEKVATLRTAWKKANPGLVNALVIKRNAAKLQRTPSWANLEHIKEIYVEAAYWNEIWPEDPVHVDHVIPLRGELVSGLHVESNLQILRASENIKKSNNFNL